MKETVLITGGCGFIGSHVAEEYLKEGYKVIVFDNLSNGSEENVRECFSSQNFVFVKGDINNTKLIRNIMKKYTPSIINHHAAQKSIPFSVEFPKIDVENNILGLLSVLQCCEDHPINKFIFVSSGGALSKCICGTEKSKEDDTPSLESPYAISKFAGENYVKLYSELYQFNYSILRYGNVYGPRQIADGECGVIPIFINNILSGKTSILTTYEDMPFGCTRDYIYVKDVAKFNLAVSKNASNRVYNVASGRETPILNVFKETQRVFGSYTDILVKGPRLGDIKRSVLDITRARQELNWQPSVSLHDGLSEIREWMNREIFSSANI